VQLSVLQTQAKETIMNVVRKDDVDQRALWNGRGGSAWVETQELLDRVLQPFEDMLVEAVSAEPAHSVLDVGCGTGGTTLAIARHLGANGRCVGIDISAPMLATARARAEGDGIPATFVCADAQDHAFEPASFDMIVSRFGVMFFGDFVRAFANLRHAARRNAALRFIAWRSPAENPFMTTAERAAAPLLPYMPARAADGPGQFAFADRRRVERILEESGWSELDIRAIDVECALGEKELLTYVTRLGPVGLILHELDDRTRSRVVAAVRSAFDPYVHGADVHFTAACWIGSARAP
jgi:ubiquinone/menaquinone biosynthesis C-methylase UbiE